MQQRDEEWLITAIKKLLAIEPYDQFSEEDQSIVIERIETYKKDPRNGISIDEIKNNFRNESKRT